MQLLELNDQEIAWFNDQGQCHAEPGVALVERDTVLYGEPALARSRLAPRGFQDQHWQLLNSDSLAVTAPGVQNNADLVFRHLRDIAGTAGTESTPDAQQVICAVPGTLSSDQLGLLLGIAQEAGVHIASFVNTALLYCLDQPLPAEAWCLDIHKRRGVLTRLSRNAASLRTEEDIELQQMGMNGLIDSWLDLLVDQFVARSRFDPLRVAETEQQLFDQVRHWRPDQGALSASVEHQGSQREVQLSPEELSGRAQQRYRTAHAQLGQRATIVLTPRASALPGFGNYLSGHGHTVIDAAPGASWRTASASPELRNPEAVLLLSELGTHTDSPLERTDVVLATHVLADHVAIPLAQLARNHATLAGTPANGYLITAETPELKVSKGNHNTDAPLVAGDELQVGSKRYLCIQVTHDEATEA